MQSTAEIDLGQLFRSVELFGEQCDTREGSEDFTALLREVELYTEQWRESRMRKHFATARKASEQAEDLIALAEVTGGLEGFGRASERPCDKCGARPHDPCVALKSGEPIKAFHKERVGIRELHAREVWHERRGKGESTKFDRLRMCGGEVIAIRCRACADLAKVRPVGCDVRLCEECSIRKARARRAQFGRGRGRVILDALRNEKGRGPLAGEGARYRKGGRYTDKMLTLTIPHVDGPALWFKALDIEAASPEDARAAKAIRALLERGSSTVVMRVAALFLAWPIFWRLLRADFKKRGRNDHNFTKFDRFFEWTPGGDGKGHPHFHVWLWSPFVCDDRVRELWTRALRTLGVPMQTHVRECERCTKLARVRSRKRRRFDVAERKPVPCTHVVGARAWVQRMYDFDARSVRELMKDGGSKAAIQLSSFQRRTDGDGDAPRDFAQKGSGGRAVHDYAGGWSVAEVMGEIDASTLGDLEIALTGRRLAQGSAGLYADDAPASCPCCGCVGTRVAVTWSADDTKKTHDWNLKLAKTKGRSPPHGERERLRV